MNPESMSKAMAAYALLEMMKDKNMTSMQIEALQLGVKSLVKRHADHMKNRAHMREKGETK